MSQGLFQNLGQSGWKEQGKLLPFWTFPRHQTHFWRFEVKVEKDDIVKIKAGGCIACGDVCARACQSPDVGNRWGSSLLTAPEDTPEAQAFVPQGTHAKNQGAKNSPKSPTLPKYLYAKNLFNKEVL